ncbi:hypothetical protein HDF26_001397 [Pedobacter cryoconitis]|uniref:DUF7832 domain-containing protein n=1 Tax=Pedobacter cryoconitis TaxID=188932 RepID=A0A7W8ZPX1_9SPHI|nr:hypothetical protein [Pedobacter cryoconitis]MBB5638026.1 hypothetical protein [Pedobacter cryoconitis]MBB6270970.1 hypothetical protein [Pedobacter cryoconitis]
MKKYDDASWHYEGDFPPDLPKINGATHIGIFLTWFIENGLLSQEQIKDGEEDIKSVKNRTLTGSEYLMHNCDGKLTSNDLSKIGNEFAKAYYEDGTKFAKAYKDYVGDYAQLLNIRVVNNLLDQDALYRIGNSWSNYDLLKVRIDERFEQWKEFKKKK